MKKIITTVKKFFKSFDEKDWNQMAACLAETLELDYQSFRGTPKYTSTSAAYIEKRKKGLTELKTEHLSTDYTIIEGEGEAKCKCRFEIRRYAMIGEDYFHSFGTYEIGLKIVNNEWKIASIKQILERNEGNRNIHGAFRK